MNLHHLAVFHAVAEHGSLSQAARRLHISQPAISRELKIFEARLNVALFERLPRGVRLTEAGRVLYEHSCRLFAVEQAAEAAMHELAEARSGHLTLGASNTIGTYLLPQRLAALRRKRPRVRVTLFVGNTEQVSRGVLEMHFMLGFIEGPLHVKGLETRVFGEDELLPVVAADAPLAKRKGLRAADVADSPLLMREPGSGSRELIAVMLQRHHITIGDKAMEFDNTEALKRAAIHGGGIAWLPRSSVRDELDQGQLCELAITSMHIRRPLTVLRRKSALASPLERQFLQHIEGARSA